MGWRQAGAGTENPILRPDVFTGLADVGTQLQGAVQLQLTVHHLAVLLQHHRVGAGRNHRAGQDADGVARWHWLAVGRPGGAAAVNQWQGAGHVRQRPGKGVAIDGGIAAGRVSAGCQNIVRQNPAIEL